MTEIFKTISKILEEFEVLFDLVKDEIKEEESEIIINRIEGRLHDIRLELMGLEQTMGRINRRKK